MEKETTYNQAKLWQIGAFAFNNTASNAYNFFFMYIAYYMTGFIGLATVAATTFITSMRVFDAVTDPFIGLLVDRTSTRFGKNRPFMLLGNVIMLVASGIMFFVVIQFPMALRFPAFILNVEKIFLYGSTHGVQRGEITRYPQTIESLPIWLVRTANELGACEGSRFFIYNIGSILPKNRLTQLDVNVKMLNVVSSFS